jgi:hypothetical protein
VASRRRGGDRVISALHQRHRAIEVRTFPAVADGNGTIAMMPDRHGG